MKIIVAFLAILLLYADVAIAQFGPAGLSPTGDISGTTVGAPSIAGSHSLNFHSSGNGYTIPDGTITIAHGGAVPYQGILTIQGGNTFIAGYDGTPQFSAGFQQNSAEYWQALGGPTGSGGTWYATNGLFTSGVPSGSVNGNLVMQNQGSLIVANGMGELFAVQSSPGVLGSFLTIQASNPSATFGGSTAALISNGDLALVPSGGANRVSLNIPDGTSANGNNRGSGAVDLMFTRSNAAHIASGNLATLVGGSDNTASGANSGCIAGFSNVCDGSYSSTVGGQNGVDEGRYGGRFYASHFFSGGPSQMVDQNFSGTSVAGAATRLTANAGTAAGTGTNNCLNIPSGRAVALGIKLVGHDISTTGRNLGYFVDALLVRDAAASTTTITLGTPVTVGTDTATVSITADATLACINATVTPDNSDNWDWTMSLSGPEEG